MFQNQKVTHSPSDQLSDKVWICWRNLISAPCHSPPSPSNSSHSSHHHMCIVQCALQCTMCTLQITIFQGCFGTFKNISEYFRIFQGPRRCFGKQNFWSLAPTQHSDVPVRPLNGHFVSALCVERAISPGRGDIRHFYGKIESFMVGCVTEPSKAVIAF